MTDFKIRRSMVGAPPAKGDTAHLAKTPLGNVRYRAGMHQPSSPHRPREIGLRVKEVPLLNPAKVTKLAQDASMEVPEGCPKIARRFIAGLGTGAHGVPEGRLIGLKHKTARNQSVPRGTREERHNKKDVVEPNTI